jgi:heme/copper-type cytochrome/quinol oxidase subunit 3
MRDSIMSVATVADSPALSRQSRRGTSVLLAIAAVIAITFFIVAAVPYLSLNEARFGPYWALRNWLLLHIGGGAVALLTGPVQLWLGLSDRRMGLHRSLGFVYIASVIAGSIGAFYLASHTQGGWVFGAGLTGLGVAWLVTTGLAFVAITRQLYDQHKEWMIRSYVVTFAFVTFRALQGTLSAANVGTLPEQLAAASWFCWAVPLLITEAILQGRKIVAVGRVL